MGSTKKGEYSRSAELFKDIYEKQGAKYSLMFLVDSGYNNKDLKEILKCFTHTTSSVD